MHLHPRARSWYQVEITTTPAVVGTWSASFDGGRTWTDGENPSGSLWRWLVAGPLFDPAEAGIPAAAYQLVSATVTPLGRVIDNPEVEVVHLPQVSIA